MPSAKEEVERLMNTGVEFAKEMLLQHGEFHPYANVLTGDGSIQDVAAFDGRECPPGAEALGFLEAGLREAVEMREYRAVAVFTNVTVADQETGARQDAVCAGLEHCDGYSVNVFFPYAYDGASLEFGQLFATAREPVVYG